MTSATGGSLGKKRGANNMTTPDTTVYRGSLHQCGCRKGKEEDLTQGRKKKKEKRRPASVCDLREITYIKKYEKGKGRRKNQSCSWTGRRKTRVQSAAQKKNNCCRYHASERPSFQKELKKKRLRGLRRTYLHNTER